MLFGPPAEFIHGTDLFFYQGVVNMYSAVPDLHCIASFWMLHMTMSFFVPVVCYAVRGPDGTDMDLCFAQFLLRVSLCASWLGSSCHVPNPLREIEDCLTLGLRHRAANLVTGLIRRGKGSAVDRPLTGDCDYWTWTQIFVGGMWTLLAVFPQCTTQEEYGSKPITFTFFDYACIAWAFSVMVFILLYPCRMIFPKLWSRLGFTETGSDWQALAIANIVCTVLFFVSVCAKKHGQALKDVSELAQFSPDEKDPDILVFKQTWNGWAAVWDCQSCSSS